MELSELLKILRGSQSLRELEKEIGISNAYLSQLETGKIANVSVNVLAKICRHYPHHKKQILESVGL